MSDAAPPAQKTSTPYDRSLVEGPVGPAVWKLAWPTMMQNVIAGLQGVVDHVLVGHLIGYTANAAIGVRSRADRRAPGPLPSWAETARGPARGRPAAPA